LQHFVKLVDVGNWLTDDRLSVIFAQLIRQVFFLGRVEKRAYFRLVTPQLVAANTFVLIGVVQAFDCSVALRTLEPLWTLVPTDSLLKYLAVLGRVFEYFGRAAEVAHVVRVDAALAVVRILLSGTPSGLVHKHVEDEAVLVQIKALQVIIQVGTVYQAVRYKIILDAFVLEV